MRDKWIKKSNIKGVNRRVLQKFQKHFLKFISKKSIEKNLAKYFSDFSISIEEF